MFGCAVIRFNNPQSAPWTRFCGLSLGIVRESVGTLTNNSCAKDVFFVGELPRFELPAMASCLRRSCSRVENRLVSLHEEVLTMRKDLLAAFCTLCLFATADAAAAQQNQKPENKDKNAAEKTADKAKEAGQEVTEKAGDVKDKTVKGAKKAGEKTKDVAGDAADKAGDVKDKTVDTTRKGVNAVGDKAEDVVDKTVDTTKKGVKSRSDRAEDVGVKTVDRTK